MAGPQMLQEEFDGFVAAAFHGNLTLQQYIDHRRTFFAGAGFLGLSMRELSPGDEPTDHDERLVLAIQAELREFNEAVKRGEK